MRYRRFGKTDLCLSVFSLGTMRGLSSYTTFDAIVQRAVRAGINHLETAKSYGKSEEFLGLALRSNLGVPREDLYIMTKFSPTPDAKTMAENIEQSLARLQVNYLDLVAIHGLNTWQHLEWVKNEAGCMNALREARAAGKIRHLGFSTHGPLEVILAAIETGFFEFVNLHYYYLWQRNQKAVELATEKDLGVFIISPVDKGGQLYKPPKPLEKLCQPLSPIEFNYRFLLEKPYIHTLSLGAAVPEELEAALSVCEQDGVFTAEELDIKKRLEHHLKDTLGSDRCAGCYQCLPCPEEINIPEILRLRNLTVAYGMEEFGKYRYRMLENAGHWFPGKRGDRCTECGECLPRCPQNLPIPQLLKDTHEKLKGKARRRLWQ